MVMERIRALSRFREEFMKNLAAGHDSEKSADLALTSIKSQFKDDLNWPDILDNLVEWQILLKDVVALCPVTYSTQSLKLSSIASYPPPGPAPGASP